jgi:uncharacterized protein YndB with AHSA1/START domain
MQRIGWTLLIGLVFLPSGAHGEIVDSRPDGFESKLEASISASPDSVYRALVYRIGSWWNAEHTWSGDPKNLTIDPRPGGCFCEKLPNGGGVQHLTVIYVAPGKILRMTGVLGPLQASGLTGTMTWEFQEALGGTNVVETYSVGGYFQGGLQSIAPVVDSVLLGQLMRLKGFVETGNMETK